MKTLKKKSKKQDNFKAVSKEMRKTTQNQSFAAAPWHDKDLVVSTACDYKPGPKEVFPILPISPCPRTAMLSHMEVSINGGAQNGWFMMDDLGVPLF